MHPTGQCLLWLALDLCPVAVSAGRVVPAYSYNLLLIAVFALVSERVEGTSATAAVSGHYAHHDPELFSHFFNAGRV